MKKILSIFAILLMIATISFAAYPAELEDAENLEAENLEIFTPEDVEEISDVISTDEIEELISNNEVDTGNAIFDDLYKCEEDVTVNQDVDGNAYIIGQNVTIDSVNIYGNLYVIGENIEIKNSEITGSIYAIGKDISFSGTTYDIYAIGQNVNLEAESYIWRTVRAVANHLNVNCSISRDLYAAVDKLNIGSAAYIEGNLNYTSENEAIIAEGAKIDGETSFDKQDEAVDVEIEETKSSIIFGYVYDAVKVAVRTLIIALIVVYGINKFNNLKRTDNVANDLLKETGKGLGVFVAVPFISILLVVSVFGTFFGLALLALYIIAICVAIPVVSLEITQRILAKKSENELKKGKIIGCSVLVSLVIWLVGFVPAIGGLIKAILVLMGIGVIFDLIIQKNKKVEEVVDEK